MTLKQAKQYIKSYCEFYDEVSSWAVEGVISPQTALNLTDEETIIALAEDLQQQVRDEMWDFDELGFYF